MKVSLDDLPKHIDGVDVIAYLIINDGSKDDTVEIAREWGVQPAHGYASECNQ